LYYFLLPDVNQQGTQWCVRAAKSSLRLPTFGGDHATVARKGAEELPGGHSGRREGANMNHSANTVDRPIPAAASSAIDHRASPPLLAAEPVIDTQPVIDARHLARMTLGDERLEREVLELFARQADMLLGRMTDQPLIVVAGLSHTLMGSARGVGAWKVAAAAQALERLGTVPTVPVVAAIKRLSEAVAEVKAAVAKRYGAIPGKSGDDLSFT
jgi:hypothetical protein